MAKKCTQKYIEQLKANILRFLQFWEDSEFMVGALYDVLNERGEWDGTGPHGRVVA